MISSSLFVYSFIHTSPNLFQMQMGVSLLHETTNNIARTFIISIPFYAFNDKYNDNVDN